MARTDWIGRRARGPVRPRRARRSSTTTSCRGWSFIAAAIQGYGKTAVLMTAFETEWNHSWWRNGRARYELPSCLNGAGVDVSCCAIAPISIRAPCSEEPETHPEDENLTRPEIGARVRSEIYWRVRPCVAGIPCHGCECCHAARLGFVYCIAKPRCVYVRAVTNQGT